MDTVGAPYRDQDKARIAELEGELEELRKRLPVVRLELPRRCVDCKYYESAPFKNGAKSDLQDWCNGPPAAAARPHLNGTLCKDLRTPHVTCPSWRAKDDPDDAFVVRTTPYAPPKVKLYKVRFAASMLTALGLVQLMTSWRAYALAPMLVAVVLLHWVARKLP